MTDLHLVVLLCVAGFRLRVSRVEMDGVQNCAVALPPGREGTAGCRGGMGRYSVWIWASWAN